MKKVKKLNEIKTTTKITNIILGIIGIGMISSWVIILFIIFFPFLG